MRATKVIPISRWSEADQAAWAVAIGEGDVFDSRGPAAHWSEGSRRSIASGYGRWIGYLENMEPECLELAPSVRVTKERIRAYVSELEGSITPSGLFNYVKHLYDAIRVMAPTADWSWLRELAKRLGQRIVRRPKRERMRDGDQLLDLGIGLMESAEENPSLPLMLRTVQYRDGLIIAILASRAPRRRNLAMMRIGRHVQKIGDIFYLVFEGDETKNGQPLESPLPKLLTSYIDHYLAAIRPRFQGADRHDGFWASMKGGPMTAEAIYDQVRKRTTAAFGKPLNLHLFRDCLATTLATKDPAHVLIARDLLGHSTLRTTEQYYNQARMLEAGRAYQDAVLGLRNGLSGPPNSKPKERR